MLELHLLFIRVLLSLDISTVPEKEMHISIMILRIMEYTQHGLLLPCTDVDIALFPFLSTGILDKLVDSKLQLFCPRSGN